MQVHCMKGNASSVPGWRAKIPHALWPKNLAVIKQKQYCNKFSKDFKNDPHQEKSKKKEYRKYENMVNIHAAAAKSLQSCPTLCNPIDGSPPGSPVPGILQARTLEWVAISFSST